jgi:hypothetical protein
MIDVKPVYFETERFGKIIPHYMLSGMCSSTGKKKTLLCGKELAFSFGEPQKYLGGNRKIGL